MGRKRIPSHQKKVQTSVSLKQSTVDSIDSWTHRRSAWIEHAIELKMEEVSVIDDLSLFEILNLALKEVHRNQMDTGERAVILQIWQRLFSKLE